MRRGTARMANVRSTEPRHSARAPCSRCRKPTTPVRIELASALRAKQINVHVTVHLTSLQQARWASALSAPLHGAPLAGRSCGMGAAADAPEPSRAAAPSGLHSRASCQWSRATERRVACRRLVSQVQTVVWSGRSESQMPQRGRARLAGSPPACDGAAVVLRGPVWPRLVRQHSELGADGRCKAAWLPPSWATSAEAKLRFGSTARSDRSMEPAARELELRPSPAQRLDRRTPSCKRSAA
jgi:hypothetical protein